MKQQSFSDHDLSRGRLTDSNTSRGKKTMTTSSNEPIETMPVKILDKEFQVACPKSEQPDLLKAANLFDTRIKEIRASGKVVGLERMAIIAGLNITHEMIQAKSVTEGKDTKALIKNVNSKLDGALQRAKQLEI